MKKERKVKIVTWLLVFCFVISLGISILSVNKLSAETDEKVIPRDIQPPFKSSFSIERLRNTNCMLTKSIRSIQFMLRIPYSRPLNR